MPPPAGEPPSCCVFYSVRAPALVSPGSAATTPARPGGSGARESSCGAPGQSDSSWCVNTDLHGEGERGKLIMHETYTEKGNNCELILWMHPDFSEFSFVMEQ